MVQMGLYTFLRSWASCPALPAWVPFLAFLEEVVAAAAASFLARFPPLRGVTSAADPDATAADEAAPRCPVWPMEGMTLRMRCCLRKETQDSMASSDTALWSMPRDVTMARRTEAASSPRLMISRRWWPDPGYAMPCGVWLPELDIHCISGRWWR